MDLFHEIHNVGNLQSVVVREGDDVFRFVLVVHAALLSAGIDDIIIAEPIRKQTRPSALFKAVIMNVFIV